MELPVTSAQQPLKVEQQSVWTPWCTQPLKLGTTDRLSASVAEEEPESIAANSSR
jgi:hypothetical protein